MSYRNKSVSAHQFSMVPRSDIPRSTFMRESALKTSFDAGYLVPCFVDEVLPGDSINLRMTAFARLATPVFPFMDNLHFETFFFFVPCRLLWSNWKKFMGEQLQPGDSISYVIPQIVSKAGGYDIGSLYDYFGLPTVGQVLGGNTVSHSALPLRAYGLIYNEWFRDQNLCVAYPAAVGDGPDLYTAYALEKRGKRHDYFTSALPWTQKSTSPVSIPLSGNAPVRNLGWVPSQTWTSTGGATFHESGGTSFTPGQVVNGIDLVVGATGTSGDAYPTIYADLSAVTSATINQLRQSFAIQRFLESNARGGTRYTEIILSRFGVHSPDARLQRPEYLGGGSTPVVVNPIAQTSATDVTGSTTPQGSLSGFATSLARDHGFTQSFTEHGYIVGLMNVRADLTYQQGMRKMWSRSTLYDFYAPEFANLGEQAIYNKEIYCDGSANDNLVFGYQERWAEYRYFPSMVTGLMRSTAPNTIDAWHLAQNFGALPTLNSTFILENPPIERVVAVGSAAAGQQFVMDAVFEVRSTRPMPLYSVPGMAARF